MTRNEAAVKVNEAFKAAKVTEALHDAKSKGFTVEIDGHVVSHTFKHGKHSFEQRRHEIAELRLALVDELLKKAEPLLKPKPAAVESAAPAVAETADDDEEDDDEEDAAPAAPAVPATAPGETEPEE